MKIILCGYYKFYYTRLTLGTYVSCVGETFVILRVQAFAIVQLKVHHNAVGIAIIVRRINHLFTITFFDTNPCSQLKTNL